MQNPYPPYPVSQAPAAPVDPIISRLKPRDIPGILDQSFRLYRKHFWTFVAIIAVVHVPVQLLIQGATVFLLGSLTEFADPYASGFSSSSFSSETFTERFTVLGLGYAAILLLGLLYGLLIYLSQGALTAGIADSHMDRPVSFGNSYRQMFGHLGSLLGLIGLQILIAVGIFGFAFLPALCALGVAAGSANNSGGAGGAILASSCFLFLFFIVAFVVYIYINVRLQLVVPAAIIENLGPVQAMRRSWRLVTGYGWRTFGLILILGILNLVVSAGPASLVAALAAYALKNNFVLQQAISGGVTVLATLFFIPLQLTAITLYYFDLRVRKEGFDLESAMSRQYGPPGQGGYAPGQPLPGGQYPQAQAGAGAYPMTPPPLGYQQQPQAYSYPQGTGYVPGGSPVQQDAYPGYQGYQAGVQPGAAPTTSFAYDPTDPTGGSWPTPQPQEPEPVEPPEGAPTEPAPEAPPPVPPPQEPYPAPDWMQPPPNVVAPEQERPGSEAGTRPTQDDSGNQVGEDKPTGQDET